VHIALKEIYQTRIALGDKSQKNETQRKKG